MVSRQDTIKSDNVVSLPRKLLQDSGPALAQIEAYWQTQRRGRLVPARCDIDPRGLNGVLENAFVLERISSGLARFRVAGSHLRDLAGLEVRGMPVSALFTPDARETLSAMIADAFDTPAIIHGSVISEGGFARNELNGSLVLLPLRSDLGDITRILGGIALAGDIGHAPRRLSIVDEQRTSLTGYAGPEVSTANAFVAKQQTFGSDQSNRDNIHELFPRPPA